MNKTPDGVFLLKAQLVSHSRLSPIPHTYKGNPVVYADAGATKHIISNGNLEISTLHNFPCCHGPIKAIYEQNERAGETPLHIGHRNGYWNNHQ